MERSRQKKDLSAKDKQKITSSGMDFSEDSRSASFLQQDGEVLLSKTLSGDVEILSMEEALASVPEAKEHYGKAFDEAGKEYPDDTKGGYFIRVKKGAEVEFPIQACLFMKKKRGKQKVHNLIMVEEGAKAHIITGCSSAESAKETFHLGVSEFFVSEGGYLNFTMIHSWEKDVEVRPKSVAVLEEGATFVSNYICLKPVKEIVMYPTAILNGKDARASFNSLILSHPGTLQDIGSRSVLRAEGTQSEMVSRAVSLGGKIVARGHLKAESAGCKGHLECRGLVLTEKGIVHAVPELETDHRDVDLSHEAAIGNISKEEIEYLRSRGMSAEEAQSVIIRGFMDVGILGLPASLSEEVRKMEEETLRSGL